MLNDVVEKRGKKNRNGLQKSIKTDDKNVCKKHLIEKEKKKGEVGTLASPGVMDGLR